MAKAMSEVKRKIQFLKDECDLKDDKIAELESRLKEEIDLKERTEEERMNLDRKWRLSEDKVDELEEQLDRLKKNLGELEQDKDAKERELRKHINEEETTADTNEQLHASLADYRSKYDNLVESTEEVNRRCQVLLEDVTRAEDQAEEYKCKYKDSETRILQLTSELQSSKAQECSLCEEQEKLCSKVDELDQLRKEFELKYEEKSSMCEMLKKEVETLEDELEKTNQIKNELKQEMDIMMQDLQDI